MFNTPVFYTLSGRSMCIHEENTVRRESARMILAKWPTGPVLPDEPAQFEIVLMNDSPTGDMSDYRLVMPSDHNPNNLVPIIDGDTLIAELSLLNFEAGSVRIDLQIWRAPGVYKYPPFRLEWVSDCERTFASDRVMMNGYDATGTTIDVPVEFLEPCPPVEFAGDLFTDSTFTINRATREEGDFAGKHKDQVRVVAVNKNSVEQPWTTGETERLVTVDLEYRTAGTTTWRKATMVMVDETDEFPAEGGLTSLASVFGYATAYWDVSTLPDGMYELRLHSVCKAASMTDPPETINEQFSKVISGVADRQAPRVFGHFAEPASGVYSPGSAVSITFDEELDCREPYGFTVKAEATMNNSPFTWSSKGINELLVVCSGRTISVEFGLSVPWDNIEGATVKMTVFGIKDKVDNMIETSQHWEYVMSGVTLAAVKASVTQLDLQRRLVRAVGETQAHAEQRCATAVTRELTELLKIDVGRVHVSVDGVSALTGFPTISVSIDAATGAHEVSTAALLTRLYNGAFAVNGSDLAASQMEWLSRVNTAVPVRIQMSHVTAGGAGAGGGAGGGMSGMSSSSDHTLLIVGVMIVLACVVLFVVRRHSAKQRTVNRTLMQQNEQMMAVLMGQNKAQHIAI